MFDSQHKYKVYSKECGGYDCEFVDPPPEVLGTKCLVCLHVLRKPKQTECCGHDFCETCIEAVQVRLCPMCNRRDFATFYDKRLHRALNQLQVRCTYQKRGCTWTGELGNLDNHLNCDDGCKFADTDREVSSDDAQMPSKNDVIAHMEEQPIQLAAEKVEGKERDIGSELQKSNERKEDFENFSAEV